MLLPTALAVAAAAAAQLAAPAAAAGLSDPQIASSAGPSLSLNSGWTATAADGTAIPGNVPGDILTDLQLAGKIGDPLYELNWKDPAQVAVWNQTWTYRRALHVDRKSMLIFDGLKMGCTIRLGETLLGTATDQYVKYNFTLEAAAATVSPQELSVTFDIPTAGRFMACSGGWDWGPFTTTFDRPTEQPNSGKDHTFTFGIWKD